MTSSLQTLDSAPSALDPILAIWDDPTLTRHEKLLRIESFFVHDWTPDPDGHGPPHSDSSPDAGARPWD